MTPKSRFWNIFPDNFFREYGFRRLAPDLEFTENARFKVLN